MFRFIHFLPLCCALSASIWHPCEAQAQGSKLTLTESQANAAGITVEVPRQQAFSKSINLTGKVALNEEKLAHIYPVVNGQVSQVSVSLGDTVEKGDLLVVVHSREVGTAKLDLYQAQLQLELAQLKLKLQDGLTTNTEELLKALRRKEDIVNVQELFAGRPMGDYRERLLQSYAAYIKSEADVERLSSVSDSGAISSKQLLAAKTARNADAATFFARIEQIDYELKTSLLQANQFVKEAETRVAVTTANLQIMGCEPADLKNIDPVNQGERISNYSIRAPFAGMIISKDVVLGEQLRPETQIMAIADLSTVWIEANIYEKDVPLLESLKDGPIRIRNSTWPNRVFQANIFFTGEIMDEKTRTITMRAIAKNTDQLLKPGMFVNVELDSSIDGTPVMQIPTNAIQEYEGKTFVFIRKSQTNYERRDVMVGERNETNTIVQAGLELSDQVVVTGGFVLKSKMLEGLLGDE